MPVFTPDCIDARLIDKDLEQTDYLAVEAVIGELIAASYSLFRGKIQGNFAS